MNEAAFHSYVGDSPEQIQRCLSCTKSYCHNCCGGQKALKEKNVTPDGEAIIGRPTVYDLEKLKELYERCVELKAQDLTLKQAAEILGMKHSTLLQRLKRYKELSYTYGLPIAQHGECIHPGRPTIWTRDNLKSFCESVETLHNTKKSYNQIAVHYGITPVTLHRRRKRYEKMIEEGEQ